MLLATDDLFCTWAFAYIPKAHFSALCWFFLDSLTCGNDTIYCKKNFWVSFLNQTRGECWTDTLRIVVAYQAGWGCCANCCSAISPFQHISKKGKKKKINRFTGLGVALIYIVNYYLVIFLLDKKLLLYFLLLGQSNILFLFLFIINF